MAQVGGRKKEHRNQRRGGGMFKKKRSAGNADSFARGGRRAKRGSSKHTVWAMHHTRAGMLKGESQAGLYTRYRNNAKVHKQNFLERQRNQRTRSRVHGSKAFIPKRYD